MTPGFYSMPHHWNGDPGTFFGSFFGQHKHSLPGQASCSPLLPSDLTPGFKSPRDVPSKANKLLSSRKGKHHPGLEGKEKAQFLGSAEGVGFGLCRAGNLTPMVLVRSGAWRGLKS